MLYELLCGRTPFWKENDDSKSTKMYRAIKKEKIKFPNMFLQISTQGKKLILQMCNKTPRRRPDVVKIMNSQWIWDNFLKLRTNQRLSGMRGEKSAQKWMEKLSQTNLRMSMRPAQQSRNRRPKAQ